MVFVWLFAVTTASLRLCFHFVVCGDNRFSVHAVATASGFPLAVATASTVRWRPPLGSAVSTAFLVTFLPTKCVGVLL
jgi:hypothetical protein